jgi:multicomponent Na+:H+ antiporter subunit B
MARPQVEDMTTLLIDVFLLLLLVITAIGAVTVRSLLAATLLLAIYSLLMALVWVSLQAVDVAFTEAAVGGGISTVLLIATLVFIGRREAPAPLIHWPSAAAVVITGAVLIYGTLDMPRFGDPQAPPHQHVAPHYIAHAMEETRVPNFVTAVLASYRGYDTLFETAVIYTAGLGLILLLRGARARRRERRR